MNKKFWEELIVYFLFTTISVSDMISTNILLFVYVQWSQQNNTIWEARMLVLLMVGIYEACFSYRLTWHDILPNLYDDQFRHSSNSEVISSKIWEAAVFLYLMGLIVSHDTEVASRGMIYVHNFMTIGSGLQVLRFLP
jgi:hypothetical protein